jgi:hypothetical protein
MIAIVSNCEREYYPNARPWLESVAHNANVPAFFVGYDWLPPDEYAPVKMAKIGRNQVRALESTYNLEHGEFVKALPDLEDDDLVIFTNCGDLVMQRAFTPLELRWLETIPVIGLGYNRTPPWCNFLIEESERLLPKVDAAEILNRFPLASTAVCYNTGVIAARIGFFRVLARRFVQIFPKLCETFDHQARQQFGICHIVAELGVTPVILPPIIHAHNCYGEPHGGNWWQFDHADMYCIGRDIVVFLHKIVYGDSLRR